MKTTFIYALNDPETGECRYIGKADDPHDRLFGSRGHLKTCNKYKHHRACWVRSLVSRGLVPLLEILQEVPETEWELWERVWIKASREIGMALVNGTDGGEGVKNPSASVRAAMGATHKGKKRLPESCAKQSATMTGKKRPPETGAAISAGKLGKKIPALSAAQLGKKKPNNTSGFVGVSRHLEGKWVANFMANQKRIYVGLFVKIEDAVFARALAVALQ